MSERYCRLGEKHFKTFVGIAIGASAVNIGAATGLLPRLREPEKIERTVDMEDLKDQAKRTGNVVYDDATDAYLVYVDPSKDNKEKVDSEPVEAGWHTIDPEVIEQTRHNLEG